MNTVGLITEYNPFHYGHLLHLNESKKLTNADISIAVMSGNFVQRGEPALLDKWYRAKMAVLNGVDLVIELPTAYACQSAEYFAIGSILTLSALPFVNDFCFGSECGDLKTLDKIATLLVNETPEFKSHLKEKLNEGLSYPVARNSAIKYSLKEDLDYVLQSSNNILGIEYLKALKITNSHLIPHTLTRVGNDYNSTELNHSISSATAIRKSIFDNGIISTKSFVPESTYLILNEFINKFEKFNSIDNYSNVINYIIMSNPLFLENTLDNEIGLSQRFFKFAQQFSSASELLLNVKTKRYTATRLQRILINQLLNTNYNSFKKLYLNKPNYIRVLGASSNGLNYLNKAKKIIDIPIITNYSKNKNIHDDFFLSLDAKAAQIYYLGLNFPLTNNTEAHKHPFIL